MTPDGYKALSKLSAQNITSINRRDSFALIGFTEEDKPSYVKQVCLLYVNSGKRVYFYAFRKSKTSQVRGSRYPAQKSI